KLNSTGSTLLASKTWGSGTMHDVGEGIAVDSSGNAFIAGWTDEDELSPYPTTLGAFQTTSAGDRDAFAVKITFSPRRVMRSFDGVLNWAQRVRRDSDSRLVGILANSAMPSRRARPVPGLCCNDRKCRST